MRPPNPPPLGGLVAERQCARDLDWPNGKVCGKTPFLHVIWSWDPDGGAAGFVCVEHTAELERKGWIPAAQHEVGADCGMPGALWYDDTCRVPDDDTAAIGTVLEDARAGDLVRVEFGGSA